MISPPPQIAHFIEYVYDYGGPYVYTKIRKRFDDAVLSTAGPLGNL